MSDKKYWNENYYNNLKKFDKDFLKDLWFIKYKDEIDNIKEKK